MPLCVIVARTITCRHTLLACLRRKTYDIPATHETEMCEQWLYDFSTSITHQHVIKVGHAGPNQKTTSIVGAVYTEGNKRCGCSQPMALHKQERRYRTNRALSKINCAQHGSLLGFDRSEGRRPTWPHLRLTSASATLGGVRTH